MCKKKQAMKLKIQFKIENIIFWKEFYKEMFFRVFECRIFWYKIKGITY